MCGCGYPWGHFICMYKHIILYWWDQCRECTQSDHIQASNVHAHQSVAVADECRVSDKPIVNLRADANYKPHTRLLLHIKTEWDNVNSHWTTNSSHFVPLENLWNTKARHDRPKSVLPVHISLWHTHAHPNTQTNTHTKQCTTEE